MTFLRCKTVFVVNMLNSIMKGVKLVMLEPDVAEIFPDAKEVNDALRMLGKLIQHHAELKNKTL